MPIRDNQEHLSLEEVAQRLNKSIDQVRELCAEGQLSGAFQRLGDHVWQIPSSSVEEWINHHLFSKAWFNRMLPRWRRLNKKVLGFPRITVGWTIAFIITLVGLYGTLKSLGYFQPVRQMDGDFRVAIAAFEVIGDRDTRSEGRDQAQGVFLRMGEAFTKLNPDFTIGLWGPDDVTPIRGATREARALSASKIADKIGADIIVYGTLDTTRPLWILTPEFYVSSANLADAQEITGQYEMGQPIEATGEGSIATRMTFSTILSERAYLLSQFAVGLSHYAAYNYATAQAFFEEVEQEYDSTEVGGKEVLYLLLGNAAGKNQNYDLAETAYQKALAVNPDYSRAYAGLASVYYIRGLQPADESDNLAAIDVDLINQSIASYKQAATASVRPALSDIDVKVHFGLGQAYLALHLQDANKPIAPAVQEFEAVIEGYGDGENQRVRELAAEAHARLGRIYSMTGTSDRAISEYGYAIDLLYDRKERQQLFEERIQELQNGKQY
ncbi:MAG: helix-turn-helix domain-containing protein [Candidatus Promineofilum sp.]|nr:helix-turn-helix domain-containing protein [Promineifilum sp.]